MAHAREQVRNAVVTILTTAAVADEVSKSRVYPVGPKTDSIALVYTNSEVITQTTLTYPRKFEREMTLVIECMSRNIAAIDDKLDSICEAVEDAIGADHTLGGLVKDCVLTDTQVTLDATGDAPIGSARMQFRVSYRTAENNAGTIIS